jgi:hypothetical protein
MRAFLALPAILLLLACAASAAPPPGARADAESAARFAEADRAWASFLAKQPRDTLALLRRGQIALFENRLADAKPLIERARAAGAAPWGRAAEPQNTVDRLNW